MARTKGKAQVNNFVGGLVTDYQELNHPQNTTVDEDNVDITREGSRRRRRGLQFEAAYEVVPYASAVTQSTMWVQTYEWSSVAEDGERNFQLVQTGN